MHDMKKTETLGMDYLIFRGSWDFLEKIVCVPRGVEK